MKFGSLAGLALHDIWGSPLRSWLVASCAFFVAGLALATVLVVQGAQDSLTRANERLGADIIVVPRGAESSVNGALLMGTPTSSWMPEADVDVIASLPGVAAASPQLYLQSLADAPCCTVPNMLMMAFDPETDFTLKPWLERELGGALAKGDAVGGSNVFMPSDMEVLELYGYALNLRGYLESTGTNLDRSLFITFDTAHEMAAGSRVAAVRPLVIPKDSVSSVMVNVDSTASPDAVAAGIRRALPDAEAVRSPDLFSTYRSQIAGLLHGLVIILALTVVLSGVLLALVFSMAVHEKRRQIGVLRALGATRATVLWSLLAEAVVLALAGGLAGVLVATTTVYLFRTLLVRWLGFPFLFPSFGSLAGLLFVGLALTLAVVALAALVPAVRVCRQEPAASMRE
jgi:putative ABC transport system permease protein